MKIALLGYGKMGRIIEQLILQKKDNPHEIILKINSKNRATLDAETLAQADVAIEFSTPDAAYSNIQLCFDARVPVVVGTTAWINHLEEIKERCILEKQALLHASNFSIGVNIFFALNKKLAQLMNGQPSYDLKITEIHHTEKLDAPSGTAISLAKDIISNNEYKQTWINQVSTEKKVLGIVSKREPKVKGTHKIEYNSPIDKIEIIHTAHSREGFAQGAIMAAEWIVGKEGMFGMNDLLGM